MMKLSAALLAAAATVASAKRGLKDLPEDMSNFEISAASKTGNKVLSKARRLDGGAEETTWIAGYSLKFQSCISYQDYNGGGAQGGQYNYAYYGGQGGQANYNGQGGQGEYYNGYNEGQYANDAYGDAEEGGEEEAESESSAEEEEEEEEAESSEDEEEGDDRRRLEQYNYYNGYNGQGGGQGGAQGMYQQRLVHFKLCPSNSCRRCKNGADYVVELGEFVEAILEGKMAQQEEMCENVKENCWCDNANNEEACIYSCYKNAGLQECAEGMYDQGFDIQEAMECSQLEVDQEIAEAYYFNIQAKNGYYGQGEQQGEGGEFFVGPYCSTNGKKIHLGIFMDETCSYAAPSGTYEALFYDSNLPYAKKSMVPTGCVSCWYPGDNYWEQQEEPEITETCANLYEMAGKCEENLDGYYPNRDNTGCAFIKNLNSPGIGTTAKVFAGIFAGATLILAGLSSVLFRRQRRATVNLADTAIA